MLPDLWRHGPLQQTPPISVIRHVFVTLERLSLSRLRSCSRGLPVRSQIRSYRLHSGPIVQHMKWQVQVLVIFRKPHDRQFTNLTGGSIRKRERQRSTDSLSRGALRAPIQLWTLLVNCLFDH